MNNSSLLDFRHLSSLASRRSSPRVSLRPLCFSDVGPLWQATRNEDFNRFISWVQPTELKEVEDRVDVLLAKAAAGEGAFISAVVRETGEWVSLFRIFPAPAELSREGSVEAGIWTHPRFWASGMSRELSMEFLNAIFEGSNAKSILAQAEVGNKASLKLFQACGLRHVEDRKYRFENDEWRDVSVYEITREQWSAFAASV